MEVDPRHWFNHMSTAEAISVKEEAADRWVRDVTLIEVTLKSTLKLISVRWGNHTPHRSEGATTSVPKMLTLAWVVWTDGHGPRTQPTPQLHAATLGDRSPGPPFACRVGTTNVPLQEQGVWLSQHRSHQPGERFPGGLVLPQGGPPLESTKPHLGSSAQALGAGGGPQRPLSLPATPGRGCSAFERPPQRGRGLPSACPAAWGEASDLLAAASTAPGGLAAAARPRPAPPGLRGREQRGGSAGASRCRRGGRDGEHRARPPRPRSAQEGRSRLLPQSGARRGPGGGSCRGHGGFLRVPLLGKQRGRRCRLPHPPTPLPAPRASPRWGESWPGRFARRGRQGGSGDQPPRRRLRGSPRGGGEAPCPARRFPVKGAVCSAAPGLRGRSRQGEVGPAASEGLSSWAASFSWLPSPSGWLSRELAGAVSPPGTSSRAGNTFLVRDSSPPDQNQDPNEAPGDPTRPQAVPQLPPPCRRCGVSYSSPNSSSPSLDHKAMNLAVAFFWGVLLYSVAAALQNHSDEQEGTPC